MAEHEHRPNHFLLDSPSHPLPGSILAKASRHSQRILQNSNLLSQPWPEAEPCPRLTHSPLSHGSCPAPNPSCPSPPNPWLLQPTLPPPPQHEVAPSTPAWFSHLAEGPCGCAGPGAAAGALPGGSCPPLPGAEGGLADPGDVEGPAAGPGGSCPSAPPPSRLASLPMARRRRQRPGWGQAP